MKIQLIQDIMAIRPDLNDKGLARDTIPNLQIFLQALQQNA